jgi:ADP-ribosyl-[dinitrogen reductase] hydrolase
MPLEFETPRPLHALVREMTDSRLPAGSFTDDTEMALALAESLEAHRRFDPGDVAQRFIAWARTNPPDIGIHTGQVLTRIAAGEPWEKAAEAVQADKPNSAGNGSVMRCWPVALADWNHVEALIADSMQQSRVTHAHPDCLAACVLVNIMIYHLLRGVPPGAALSIGLESVSISTPFQEMITAAPQQARENLPNSGWVCHTVESAVWGLLTTSGFEDAVVQVVNLGNDADTAGAVVGALAGACYGLKSIPMSWRQGLRGQWPLNSGVFWSADDFVRLADSLMSLGAEKT